MSAQKQEKSGNYKFGAVVKMAASYVQRMTESIFSNEKYINWGENNEFPQMLIDLYNTSPTHRAILNSKMKYISGKGLYSEDSRIQAWLNQANRFGESWNDIWKRQVRDNEIFNAQFIEVRQTRPNAKPSYYFMDASKCRLASDLKHIYFSEQWCEYRQKVYDHKYHQEYQRISAPKTKKIPIYDPESEFQSHYVMIHFVSRPGMRYYPEPYYQASLADIRTDAKIANYNLNEITNNFALGGTIIFKEGAPQTDEEKKEHQDLMEKMYGDTENAGGWRSLFAMDNDSAPEIVAHDGNNLADRYTNLKDRVEKSIFIGHEITSQTLFGIPTPGALSQRSELLLAYELFNNLYVDDRRSICLDFIKKICSKELNIKDPEIWVEERKPIDKKIDISEGTMRQVMTTEEIRRYIDEEIGFELDELPPAQMSRLKKFESDAENYAAYLFEELAKSKNLKYEEVQKFMIEHDENGMPMEFATDLDNLEEKILKMIRDNKDISRTQIAEAMNMKLDDVALIISELQRKNFIKFTSGVSIALTIPGAELKLNENLPKTKLMYRYALRPDAPALKPGSVSRDFCRRMEALPPEANLFSKEEIDLLNNQMKESPYADVQDVWLSRGGWYRPVGKDISVPFCRHIWEQVLIIEK